MPFTIALAADLGLTPTAFTIFLPILFINVPRFDPFTTTSCWTVYTISSRVFLELQVPLLLKIVVKQPFNMF